jgi:hypothetical protein
VHMSKESLAEKCKEAVSILKKLGRNKKLYARLEELTEELETVRDLESHGLQVVDNFAQKNTAFRQTAFKRVELKLIGEKKGKK